MLGLIPLILGVDKYLLALRRKKGYRILEQTVNTAYLKAKTEKSDLAEMFCSSGFVGVLKNGFTENENEFKKYGLNTSDVLVVRALINSIKTGDAQAVNSAFESALIQISNGRKNAEKYAKNTALMYLKASLFISAAVFLIIV